MKRSKSLKIALMGASVLTLSACEDPHDTAAIFKDVDECARFEGFELSQCRENFEVAEKEHIRVAPKYNSIEECQADFGPEQCEQAPMQTTSGGSVFMPLMMGYMMGSMMSPRVAPQPLYRSSDDPGNFRTADNQKVSGKTGLQSVPKTATQRPSTKTTTVRRGGFGATAKRMPTSYRSFGG